MHDTEHQMFFIQERSIYSNKLGGKSMCIRERMNLMGNFATIFLVFSDEKKMLNKQPGQTNPGYVSTPQPAPTPTPTATPVPATQAQIAPQTQIQTQPQAQTQQQKIQTNPQMQAQNRPTTAPNNQSVPSTHAPIQTQPTTPKPNQQNNVAQQPMNTPIQQRQQQIQQPQIQRTMQSPQPMPMNVQQQNTNQPIPNPNINRPPQFYPNQQQIFIPKHQITGPDPYLQPYHNIPEVRPSEPNETELTPDHELKEMTIEPSTETFSYVSAGKDQEIVEHDVLAESVVEAPNLETATFDLSSAKVVEVKQESVYYENEEIVVHGADDKEKDIWKPPDSNEE